MNIIDYCTNGGKNLIVEYIDSLEASEKLSIYDIREKIRQQGLSAFSDLNTRQLKGKLWEIKYSQTRIMYVIINTDGVYFVNICKKEKGRAEKKEIRKAIQRAKEGGLKI